MLVRLAGMKKIPRNGPPEDKGPQSMDFASGRKYPYTWFLVIIFLTFVLCCLVLLFVSEVIYFLAIWLVAIVLIIIFGAVPLMMPHTVAKSGITLRHGFYSLTIPASNIKELCTADEDVPFSGLGYSIRRRKQYVANSPSSLVCIEVNDPTAPPFSNSRPVHAVVTSVEDMAGFLSAAEKILGVDVSLDNKCPECRRPVAEHMKEAPVPAAKPALPRIEYIFLIHEDGRLVFQYTGGRLQVASSSVSGMLIVIQDFIRDAFKTDGGILRKLEHGDLTVVIEGGKFLYLAVVVSGQEYPDTLRDSMKRTLKEAEHDFGDVLRVWDGRVPDGIGKVVSQVLWS